MDEPTLQCILFVEDTALQRELTERLYKMVEKVFHGATTFLTAESWQEAMKKLKTHPVDVLIADLVLPPMSADETLLAIRDTEGLPPVVALTGYSSDERDFIAKMRRKCFAHGCDDFVCKQDVNHHPEILCERVFHSFLRKAYART